MPFLACLATAAAETLSPETLCAQARAMWPGVPKTALKPMIDLAAPDEAPGGTGFILEAATYRYTVLFVPAPLPTSAYATHGGIMPDAEHALADHRAHVLIATASTLATPWEARDAASVTSLIVAALTTRLPATAVLWTNGGTISPPASFREAALGIQRGRIPVAEWIGIDWRQARPSAQGDRQYAAMTTGLDPFIGHEVELAPSPFAAALLAERLATVCQHLILTGHHPDDDETQGLSHTERLRLRARDQGTRPGIPILELSVEPLVSDWTGAEAPRRFGRRPPEQFLELG